MAILVSTLIARVAKTLLDDSMVGWSEDELYDYFNAAQSAVVNAKPDAHTTLDSIPLAAGVLQQMPGDCVSILAIYHNTTGEIVNQVGRDLLNQSNKRWPQRTQEAVVEEYVVEQNDPTRFLVNPPNDGTGSLEILYGSEPPAVAPGSPSDVMALPDTYQNAVWAYVLALAYAKNSKRQDLGKSGQYLGMFREFVGMRAVAQSAQSPKLDNTEPQ
jgi:hypothetical protein